MQFLNSILECTSKWFKPGQKFRTKKNHFSQHLENGSNGTSTFDMTPKQRSMDCQVGGPTRPTLSEIFKFLLVLVRSRVLKFFSVLVRTGSRFLKFFRDQPVLVLRSLISIIRPPDTSRIGSQTDGLLFVPNVSLVSGLGLMLYERG